MRSIFRFFSLFGLVSSLVLPAHSGDAILDKESLIEVQPGIWAAGNLKLPEVDADLPVLGTSNRQDGARLFRILNSKQSLNGFDGVLYDNRDRGHSPLEPDLYPGLMHLKYEGGLAEEGYDIGLAGRILFPAVVFGNSSAAVTRGPAPRSLPRLAMTSRQWQRATSTLYLNNHIYVYPEHHDHDAADRFPVNWPYMIISQGSSGSDRKFLTALALTIAALPSETFSFLQSEGLIAPTLQMILRRNLTSVSTREDYLSGLAHPPAFGEQRVQIEKMVAQAVDLRPEDVPPMVRLRVIEENFSNSAGLAGLDERLLDSPAAIGRLWRSLAWEREMIVTAEGTNASNEKPLTYEWRLLRGDPERVSIEPQGHDGRTARIRISWHNPWTEQRFANKEGSERQLSRVDIGVFANNGVYDSAPSLISIDFPQHQKRQYAVGGDGKKRLVSVDYDAEGRKTYFDPLLYWSAGWTDTARYEASGTLKGWDRRYSGQDELEFVPFDPNEQVKSYQMDLKNPRRPTLRHAKEHSQKSETETQVE